MMNDHAAARLTDDEVSEVSGGTLGAAVSDAISVGGATAMSNTVSPTGGYADDDVIGEGAGNTEPEDHVDNPDAATWNPEGGNEAGWEGEN